MNVEDMTPEQLRKLADQKEQEVYDKVYGEGTLLEDMYYFAGNLGMGETCSYMEDALGVEADVFYTRMMTMGDIEKITASFKRDLMDLVFHKGSKFAKIKDTERGEFIWCECDTNIGVDSLEHERFAKYLKIKGKSKV